MEGGLLPAGTVWVDLLHPTQDEENLIERILGINIPAHDEMQEIETSSRLYTEEGAVVMTMSVLHKPPLGESMSTVPVTFILFGSRLITVRYADPSSIAQFVQKAKKHPSIISTGNQALIGLLEQTSDNLADVLESATSDLESLSQKIFDSIIRCRA